MLLNLALVYITNFCNLLVIELDNHLQNIFIYYSVHAYLIHVNFESYFLPQIDGEPYWYYEYLVRKSPTKNVSISSSKQRLVDDVTCSFGFLLILMNYAVSRIK